MSLGNLPKVTKIVNNKSVIQTQTVQLPNLLSELLSSPASLIIPKERWPLMLFLILLYISVA